MSNYLDYEYLSRDGLRLYARDYAAASPKGTLLCLPGLTANSADFEGLASHLASEYRVVAPDLRGRGRSELGGEAPAIITTVDLQDMFHLVDLLSLERVIVLGTSLSGQTAMSMAALSTSVPLGEGVEGFRATLPGSHQGLVAGLIMNDMGSEIGAASFENGAEWNRIASRKVSTWDEAAEQLRDLASGIPADYNDEDWLRRARARYREDRSGVPVLAYDPRILPPLPPPGVAEGAAPKGMDLWPFFEATKAIPTLVLRGALSTTLTAEGLREMERRNPRLQSATIPGRGHCPSLEEAESIAAIDSFLAGLDRL